MNLAAPASPTAFFPFEIGLFLAGVLSHRVYAYMNSRGVMRLPISLAIGATLIGTVPRSAIHRQFG